MNLKILIVDDEQRIITELSEYLKLKGYTVYGACGAASAFDILAKHHIDIMFLDIRMPEMDGLQVLQNAKKAYPALEVILISGHGDMDTLISALRNGATDYLKKPFRQKEVLVAIERTQGYLKLKQQISQLKNENSLISRELENSIEKTFIAESPKARAVLKEALMVASFADTPVLLCGESGTGKEIIARIIHYASPRKKARFYPINCSAIPENLMESEFFGHKKGTFTGAFADKRGYLEAGNGGTIFLDEIGDMPINLQAKLLRVIEEHKYIKLGDDREQNLDIRFICATNKSLEKLIERGAFREDLYYRLNTFKLELPPLRDRKEDILPLVNHFVSSICQKNGIREAAIGTELIDILSSYGFPGNIRELKNLVERALIINQSGTLNAADFPVFCSPAPVQKLENSEKQQILQTLHSCGGNRSKAAEVLGISRFALLRKLKKYTEA